MSWPHQQARPFNTPIESGMRLLFALEEAKGEAFDLQRLVSYDYLLVHSGDVESGPASLHPAVPFRGGELLVKRELVRMGLDTMFAKELLEKSFEPTGICYRATALTGAFLKLLVSAYASSLRERATWVVARFAAYTDEMLESYMTENVGRWGAEFDRLTAIKELEL
ncbi:ABC-three component system middle component 2 [Sphingomonas sp. CFBP9019]|uniref:ABC-three component system middle component 2 n=1 Tax=Sphingomonas sp. CFBP9019 TaxID=3096532 RepID=UPI002A69EFFA|nr:ABC-three component system middle component 2 [Sphingomonas sp. CFBP9019]MDY1007380.1 ABC-three component system middle component 2 [Sphingomonas sp. CFBP9019]